MTDWEHAKLTCRNVVFTTIGIEADFEVAGLVELLICSAFAGPGRAGSPTEDGCDRAGAVPSSVMQRRRRSRRLSPTEKTSSLSTRSRRGVERRRVLGPNGTCPEGRR
jgi:hypothetical protein